MIVRVEVSTRPKRWSDAEERFRRALAAAVAKDAARLAVQHELELTRVQVVHPKTDES